MDTADLLNYLPAIYHEDKFLGQFLRPFETLLLGDEDDKEILSNVKALKGLDKLEEIKGLEKKIVSLLYYFDPHRAPERFLPWLSSWTGFALRADLPQEKKRDFIASAISLYRMRGTKANMERLLEIFTSRKATVKDQLVKPFYFKVRISFNDTTDIERNRAIAHALIEREKPAHTSFALELSFPTMKIGAVRVGKNNAYLSGSRGEIQ